MKTLGNSSQETLLYDRSELNLKDFLIGLYSIKAKHNLTSNTIDDILKFFSMVLPKENKCPKDSSCIENLFPNKCSSQIVHFCCQSCKKLSSQNLKLESLNTRKNNCESCERELDPFVTFDAFDQIKQIFESKKIFNQVLRTNRRSNPKNLISDTLDGSIYNSIKSSDINHISLILNTDGAKISNSKKFDMWPFLATIVELDPISREKFSNIIILGIWLSKEKTIYDLFVDQSIEHLVKDLDQQL
ncbi:unnamed protein product [Brachionus calyciflorus]|uniref:Uncharacterized protein n=1 Tax=Brachionus calyciflorus TaxID=104777 RepID=A0A814NT03_9BILA|nr:unnamed protein product [Brachionus calyciflorus]